MGDLLKELPSFNQTNFSKYTTDSSCKSAARRPVVYLPTREECSEQGSRKLFWSKVIVTDKTNILLRYLHQQWEAKNPSKKRDTSTADLPDTTEVNCRKMRRLDAEEYSTD